MSKSHKTTLEMRQTIDEWHPIIQDYVMRDWKDMIKEGIAMQTFVDGNWKFWLVDDTETII